MLGDGEDEHLRRALAAAQRGARLDAVHAGHVQVEDDDVGAPAGRQRDRLRAVAGQADHVDALVPAQEGCRSLAHQAMIIRDEDADTIAIHGHPERT